MGFRALRAKSLLLLHLALFAAAQAAAETQFPELAPLDLAVELSAASEPLSADDLIDAALVFSGTPPGTSPR